MDAAAREVAFRLEETDDGTAFTLSRNIRSQTQLPKVLGGTFAGLGVTILALIPAVNAVVPPLIFAGGNILAGAGIRLGGIDDGATGLTVEVGAGVSTRTLKGSGF